MKWVSLAFDVLIAAIFYGLVAGIGGFVCLLLWSGLAFEHLLLATMVMSGGAAILGAAVPVTRNAAVSIVSVFTPSWW